jgi:lysyl-tRNA synthetase class 2
MAQERLEEIRQNRLKKREELLAAGTPAYPAEARRSHTLSEVNVQFDQLEKNHTPVTLIGRIMSVRKHGGIAFLDIRDASDVFQLQVSKESVEPAFFDRLDWLDSGDWIEAAGTVIKTKRGVKSLAVLEWHMLTKSIRPLPDSWFGLKDHETRYRQREVDLILNDDVRQVFMERSRIIAWLRSELHRQGFLEVETPMLQAIPGGTLAKPFSTHHNALDMPLFLRIAPELYLKRLIVGGYEKVFELGRNFRNEGIDREHNPEFTMLELYWAYADYEDLMDFTHDLFATLAPQWNKPWKRVRFVELVSEEAGFDILEEKDPQQYVDLFKQRGLDLPPAVTYGKLIDEFYKETIRPSLVEPTIVYDYPVELQPLAKQKESDPRVVEQFQFLVNGMELVKAYTELNDPVIQRQRFEEQVHAREAGDEEAHRIDESYLRALEYGMPPTAGWGLGVDRLVAVLTESKTLRDTILFPLLKPEDHA